MKPTHMQEKKREFIEKVKPEIRRMKTKQQMNVKPIRTIYGKGRGY